MPGFDRTGPEGKGSKTGRALGNCTDNNALEKNKSDDVKSFRAGIRQRHRNCQKNKGRMRNRHKKLGECNDKD